MHAARKLHACCRPSEKPTIGIKSYQSNRKCRKLFFQRRDFFLVIAIVKTRPVLKRARHGLSGNWCTQWVKSWCHAGKVMFSSHDLKTWLFQHDPMTLPTVYTNYLKAHDMLFSEQVLLAFGWVIGFCLSAVLHWEGSARSLQSRLVYIL